MLKKLTLGVLGLMLIGGLLFGGKVIPYAKTAVQKVRNAAQDSVPVAFQIDAAKGQLEQIGPEIRNMVHQIAKEEVQVKRLASDLKQHQNMLTRSYDEMMTLRSHVESGSQVYVDTRGKSHNAARVEQDLRHRFSLYQTSEKTFEKKGEILNIRKESLLAAHSKLDEAKSQQRELEMQIENLQARHRMNEVIATASQINIDNSQLAKTRQMLDDIDARISADEEYLNIAPKYFGQIPVSADSVISDTDILDEMDTYFDGKANEADSTIETDDDDLVLN
jgi:DNA repair exonuclease SbcCD ATPase subunit